MTQERTRFHYRPLTVIVLIVMSGTSLFAGSKEDNRTLIDDAIAAILETHATMNESGYRIFMRPTLPPTDRPVSPIPEYGSAGYLLVVFDPALPLEEILNEAVSIAPVMLLVSDEIELQSALRMLRKNDLGRYINSGWIRVLMQTVDSPWVRDFGPIYVKLSDGSAVAMDAIYNPRRPSLESGNPFTGLFKEEAYSRRDADELLPYFLGAELGTPTYRPPIIVSGGNFACDYCGTCFTSTETIAENGGNRELTNLVFRTYYGCKEVVYLEPLPGTQTTKHIDMFFRVADDSTYLLGSYERIRSARSVTQYLQLEARMRMDRNRRVLEDVATRQKRKIKIVRVPMPDLTGPSTASTGSEVDDSQYWLWAEMLGLSNDWSSADGFGWSERLNYIYRTYLNYTHLKSANGELVLLPSYPDDEDILRLAIQSEAEKELGKVYPNARIQRIACDDLIKGAGALHCVTLVIPEEVAKPYMERVTVHSGSQGQSAAFPAIAEFDDGELVPVDSAVTEARRLSEYYKLGAESAQLSDFQMDELWDISVEKVIRRQAIRRALVYYESMVEAISETEVVRLAEQIGGEYWTQGFLNDYFKVLARDSLEYGSLSSYLVGREGRWTMDVTDEEVRGYYEENMEQYRDDGYARIGVLQYWPENQSVSDEFWGGDSNTSLSFITDDAFSDEPEPVSEEDAARRFLQIIESVDCSSGTLLATSHDSIVGWDSEFEILDTTDYWLYELSEFSYWWDVEWIEQGKILKIESYELSAILYVCESVEWSTTSFDSVKDDIMINLQASRYQEARRALEDRLNRDVTIYDMARPAGVIDRW